LYAANVEVPAARYGPEGYPARVSQPQPLPADPLSLFSGPLFAVGSHGPTGPNAQIAALAMNASIIPEEPRLQVLLWKNNYTCGLVEESGTAAVTVLCEEQAAIVPLLGFRSGRDGPKLDDVTHELTSAGDPYFPGGIALFDCRMLASLDAGDALSFLLAVAERRWLGGETPLRRWRAVELLGPEFGRELEEMLARNVAFSRGRALWMGPEA
jgi:flavin reductase (DIM6/NTAB) family NADH-FMN oxidoreductase RutF